MDARQLVHRMLFWLSCCDLPSALQYNSDYCVGLVTFRTRSESPTCQLTKARWQRSQAVPLTIVCPLEVASALFVSFRRRARCNLQR